VDSWAVWVPFPVVVYHCVQNFFEAFLPNLNKRKTVHECKLVVLQKTQQAVF
jgi:hypothetical protein